MRAVKRRATQAIATGARAGGCYAATPLRIRQPEGAPVSHLLLDVTSIVDAPFRSGIQRVEREVMRLWPGPDELVPVTLSARGDWRLLPPEVLTVLSEPPGALGTAFEDDRARLAPLVAASKRLPNDARHRMINLELFYEVHRADAYIRLCKAGCDVRWLVYDFLPMLSPELFPQGTTGRCMHYIRALAHVPRTAFISTQTRDEYVRVVRGRIQPGPVLPLGADGLGLEFQSFTPSRLDFVLLGSIEPRKNPDRVMEAFRLLWAQGHPARLILAGRIDPSVRTMVERFMAEAGPRATLLDHPSDTALRAALRTARAVINGSEAEGFGLPPYEAVFSGIPCVAAASLPSVQLMPPFGHIALTEISPETIAAAVTTLLDDDQAARVWQATRTITLPTWKDFAVALAAWAAELPLVRRPLQG